MCLVGATCWAMCVDWSLWVEPSDPSACHSFAVIRHFHGDQLRGEVGGGILVITWKESCARLSPNVALPNALSSWKWVSYPHTAAWFTALCWGALERTALGEIRGTAGQKRPCWVRCEAWRSGWIPGWDIANTTYQRGVYLKCAQRVGVMRTLSVEDMDQNNKQERCLQKECESAPRITPWEPGSAGLLKVCSVLEEPEPEKCNLRKQV